MKKKRKVKDSWVEAIQSFIIEAHILHCIAEKMLERLILEEEKKSQR